MDGLLKRAKKILSKLVVLANQLNEILITEKENLEQANHDELAQTTLAKLNTLKQLDKTDLELNKLLRELNLSADKSGVNELLKQINSKELQANWDEVVKLLTDVRDQNIKNGTVLNISSQNVQHVLDLMFDNGKGFLYDNNAKTLKIANKNFTSQV